MGEEFSYQVEVKDGMMYLTFVSEGHPTKTFTKNLIDSEYKTEADIPMQVQELFFPIGQDGLERKKHLKKVCSLNWGVIIKPMGKVLK